MSNNRTRVLAEAVSIDAWHDPFKIDGVTSAVYVELSFSEGRLGGSDVNFPFTFKLALKRALMTIRLEKPLAMDRRTIARSKPIVEAELTTILAARESAKANLNAKGKVSPATIHLAINGEVKSEDEVTTEQRMKVVQTIPNIIVSPKPIDSQNYSWDLVPGHSETLRGQPWDPIDEPRLRVRIPKDMGQLDPVVSVKVTCALEDIEITDLKPKTDSVNEKLRNIVHNTINMRAAIQFLKTILTESELDTSTLDNRFADLVIADVLAAVE